MQRRFLSENLNRKHNWEDMTLDGNLVLNWIFRVLATVWTSGVRFPAGARISFPSPPHPDRLCETPNLLITRFLVS
jgi:hypothetical protein